MLIAYVQDLKKLRKEEEPTALPIDPVWIDLLDPTKEEEVLVEQTLQEIEVSSRLYKEGNTLFMTANVLSNSVSGVLEAQPVTFVLAGQTLITIRYCDPKSFQVFAANAQRAVSDNISKETLMLGLLESVINRLADVLESIASDVNAISQEIFKHKNETPSDNAPDFQDILRRIAQKGDLNSGARESLIGLGRLLTFLGYSVDAYQTVNPDLKGRVMTLSQDILALTDHVSFLSNKICFLLDATLGMISIEQNTTIKIFSVAAVVFLPPTLVASVYGMNFEFMPELKWLAGYPFALGLMVLSAIIPYWFFKRRGWL